MGLLLHSLLLFVLKVPVHVTQVTRVIVAVRIGCRGTAIVGSSTYGNKSRRTPSLPLRCFKFGLKDLSKTKHLFVDIFLGLLGDIEHPPSP
jgi:hypothetical protein